MSQLEELEGWIPGQLNSGSKRSPAISIGRGMRHLAALISQQLQSEKFCLPQSIWEDFYGRATTAVRNSDNKYRLPSLPRQVLLDFGEVMNQGLTIKRFLQRRSEHEKRRFVQEALSRMPEYQMTWMTESWEDGSMPSTLQQVSLRSALISDAMIQPLEETPCPGAIEELRRKWVALLEEKGRIQARQIPVITNPRCGIGEARLEFPSILIGSTQAMNERRRRDANGIGLKPLAIPSKQHCKLLSREHLTRNFSRMEQMAKAIKLLTPEDIFDLLPSHISFVSAKIRRRNRLKDALEAGEKAHRDSEQRLRDFKRRYERATWHFE